MKKGFTLIELLIVVAIIAILAAIAVPNFLEAQVRSKVSRVRTDHRSLATAIEAYYVDNNSYPASTGPSSDSAYAFLNDSTLTVRTFKIRNTTDNDFNTITTPIAYITSLFPDPFANERGMTFPYWKTRATRAKISPFPTLTAKTTKATCPRWLHRYAGSSSIPTEAKNSRPKRSRRGMISLRAWCP